MTERRLNADIGGSISSFKSIMKSFELKIKLYKRMLKGKGLEFDGYSNYTSDDDASMIDWKASKRANQLLTRRYIEEQNLKVVFLIDVSDNMIFGSSDKLKCEYAAEVIAGLTDLIISSKNKVGYVLFSQDIKDFVPPGRGDRHFAKFMDTLTNVDIYGGGSNMNNAIDFALKFLDKSISSVVLISDFNHFDGDLKEKLSLLSSRFEIMSLIIKDPLDKDLPDVSGEIVLEDSNTGERILVNPRLAREAYKSSVIEKENFISEIFRKNNIDFVELITNEPFVYKLATFLKRRTKTIKKGII